MRYIIFALVIVCSENIWGADVFRFSLYAQPHTLNPAKFSANETIYFLPTLFSGLYRFDDQKGLTPIGAKSCEKLGQKKIGCTLNNKIKWSNGEMIVAEDYVRAFRNFINPETKARESGLLLNLKNAKSILEGTAKPETLGVIAKDKTHLEFEFSEMDEEFLYKLSSPLLAPIKTIPSIGDSSTYIFNGPYKIKEWVSGKKVLLEANPYYSLGNKNRPEIEIIFIEESATALDMYRLKKLDFLTEIPTSEIPSFQNQKDFYSTPMARFDYIGFGEELRADKNLREALALSVDYEEFVKAFHAIGRPGCSGLPDFFMDKVPCLNFDLSKAKKAFEKVEPKHLEKKLKLYFTKIASNNLKSVAEWYQAQWKKHLGLDIELQQLEFGIYRQRLNTQPPQLFRVGVSLDRPTCLAAIESFYSTNKDNFIGLKSSEYDKLILKSQKTISDRERKRYCRQAVEFLIKDYHLIPQGKIHYARLLSLLFEGVNFNSLGQVDFSGLNKKNLQ